VTELRKKGRIMAEQENKQIYSRFVEEVINGGNLDAVDELFSRDYVDHSAPPGAPEGLDGVKAIPQMFRGAFPDVHFTIEDMVAERDIVATRVTGRGTHEGEFFGVAPTGMHATWASMGFFRVADGTIVEHWGAPDLLSLLQQLGAIPAPPTEGAAAPPSEQPVARSGDGATSEGPADPEGGKAVIRNYVEKMFNRHDLTGLGETLAPDYVYHVLGQDIQGLEGYEGTVYPLFEAFPDVENVIEDIVAEGDRVAIRWRAHGTHEGEFFGIPPTGKRVELTGITIERIAGGKRLEGWGVPDMLGLMQQLGAVRAPGQPAEARR